MKNTIALVIALVLGAVAVFAIKSFVGQKEEAIRGELRQVLVAARNLDVGDTLTYNAMEVLDIPKKAWTRQHNSPDKQGFISGQIVKYPIAKGEPILDSCLEGVARMGILEKIDVGMRTVTVTVSDTSSVAGMIEPGDIVDIFITYTAGRVGVPMPGEDKEKDRPGEALVVKTMPLMSKVKVIAVAQRMYQVRGKMGEEERMYSTVTLSVKPQAAALLIFAAGQGQLIFTLRNPTDDSTLRNVIPVDNRSFEDMVETLESQ